MKKQYLLFALFLVASLLLAACGGGDDPTQLPDLSDKEMVETMEAQAPIPNAQNTRPAKHPSVRMTETAQASGN